jgi:thioredoxin 2
MAATVPTLVLRCAHCARSNRVPVARLREHAHCGHCKQRLHDPGEPFTLDCDGLETLLAHAEGPVLVDFFTRASQPARFLNAELVRVAKDMVADLLVAEMDVDQECDAIPRYRILAAPQLLLFQGQREIWRATGARSAPHLEHELRSALASRPGGEAAPPSG